METLPQHVRLKEQAFRPASLTRDDLRYLSALGFQVTFDMPTGESDNKGMIPCQVNPNSSVGHFRLPSGRIVTVEPKVETASIFRMLAYVYCDTHRRLLRDEHVQYAEDKLLFEPLVELLNALVSARARRGLVQDYVRREENRTSFRGALNVPAHVQHNLERDNRVYCRFFEQTVDVPDNRIVKTALHHLLRFGGWTSGTTHSLIANFHKFDGVMLERVSERTVLAPHYHRLNDDYKPIHELCRMFLAGTTVSEKVGTFGFRGFLLDMNILFEQFVQKAFENVLRRRPERAEIQWSRRLSSNAVAPDIRPDVTVRSGSDVVVVADAKYKKDKGGPRNPDIYQVVVYGTVLRCNDVYLLYPQTELDSEHDIPIINSPVVVKTRRIDVSTGNLVERAEALAKEVVGKNHHATPALGKLSPSLHFI